MLEHFPFDILSKVLCMCPTLTLVTLSQTSRGWREMVQSYSHWRFHSLLSPHVGGDMDRVLTLLETTEGVVGGAVALQFADNCATWETENLNIFIPFGSALEWYDGLTKLGYEWDSHDILPGRRWAASSHHTYTHGDRIIAVTESTQSSPLAIILAAPCTCQMTVVSPSAIIAIFPNMTFRATCVCCSEEPREVLVRDHKSRRFALHASTSEWMGPCGRYCPDYWDELRGNDRVAAFKWREGMLEDPLLFAVQSHFDDKQWESWVWRFGNEFESCENVECPNYSGGGF